MSTADDYKPGDLALFVDGLTRAIVQRTESGAWCLPIGGPIAKSDDDPHLRHVLGPDERAVPKGGVHLTEADAERLAKEFDQIGWPVPALSCENIIGRLAAAQSEPPLEEPGLWGVVEADVKGYRRQNWVRSVEVWVAVDLAGVSRGWADLIDPTLVRPGIDDEGAA